MTNLASKRVGERQQVWAKLLDMGRQSAFDVGQVFAVDWMDIGVGLGESMQDRRIRVVGKASMRASCFLPSVAGDAPPLPREKLRAALALAKLDADLDVVDIAQFDIGKAQKSLHGLLQRILLLPRAGPGGEATCAAALYGLLAVFRRDLGGQRRAFADAALLSEIITSVFEVLAPQFHDLPMRLGYLTRLAFSPIGLSGHAGVLAERLVNAYQTTPVALTEARRRLVSLAHFDVEAARPAITNALLQNPAAREELSRSIRAEAIRDVMLLCALTEGPSYRALPSSLRELAEMVARPAAQVTRPLFQKNDGGALSMLRTLLTDPSAALAKESIAVRAQKAADGAIALALDEMLSPILDYALCHIEEVADNTPAAGSALHLSTDDDAIVPTVTKKHEAHLFVDLKDFTARMAEHKEIVVADLLQRHFYVPILSLCADLRKRPGAELEISNLMGDAVACRGDILSLVTLALGIRRMLDDAAAAAAIKKQTQQDPKEREARAAIDDIHQRFIDASEDERAMLRAQKLALEQGIAERVHHQRGIGLEAGVWISYGAAAVILSFGHAELGQWTVTLAEMLNQSARGTARAAGARVVRDRRLTTLRQFHPLIESPFDVAIGPSGLLEVPDDAARAFANALHSCRQQDLDDAISTLAQSLNERFSHGEVPIQRKADIYNNGIALSADALAAYREIGSRLFRFHNISVVVDSLPEALRDRWFFDFAEEHFVIVTTAQNQPLHLFRFAGAVDFKGFDDAVQTWEMLRADTDFAQDLLAALQKDAS